MFRLTMATAKINHLNLRSEVHGEDRVPAADIKLTLTQPNKLLDLIDTSLRPALWRSGGIDDGGLLPTDPDVLTEVRFPKLAPLSYDYSLHGCKVTVAYGIGSEIPLADCVADKFVIAAKAGGMVELSLRVRCKPDADDVAALYELIQHDVEVTLEPPKAGLLPDDDDSEDDEHSDEPAEATE
jgi:hypothetical protein